MELTDFIEELEKIQKGAKIGFTQEQKDFLHSEYYRTQGHYFPKSCGSCIYGYKVLLNVAKLTPKKKPVKKQPQKTTTKKAGSKGKKGGKA